MPTTIDDFSTGTHDITLRPPATPSSNLHYQSGSMLGGGRWTQLGIGFNLRSQPVHLDVGSGFLNLSVGPEQYIRLEVGYGFLPDGAGGGIPTPLVDQGVGDFLSMGNAIRTMFHSADLLSINYNIVVWTATGWASHGANVTGHPFTPSQVDFPLAEFTTNGDLKPDLSRVHYMLLVFQTHSDFVLDAIEIV